MTRIRIKMNDADIVNIPGDAFCQEGDFTYIWEKDKPVAMIRTDAILELYMTTTAKEKV